MTILLTRLFSDKCSNSCPPSVLFHKRCANWLSKTSSFALAVFQVSLWVLQEIIIQDRLLVIIESNRLLLRSPLRHTTQRLCHMRERPNIKPCLSRHISCPWRSFLSSFAIWQVSVSMSFRYLLASALSSLSSFKHRGPHFTTVWPNYRRSRL